jgi:copper(I)-binding protein
MKKLILIAFLVLITNNSFGHEYNVGNLLIDHPKIIKNENNAKGYMIITNKSESDLFLIGGQSSFSEELILHKESSTSLSNMQKISQIKIPAGSTISLKDLNLHLMFLDYDSTIEWFEPHKANLYFSNNMKLEVEFDLD